MNCPKCNNPYATECADEVDIGVGTIKHVWGYECPHCGSLWVCNTCGGVSECHSWCEDLINEQV